MKVTREQINEIIAASDQDCARLDDHLRVIRRRDPNWMKNFQLNMARAELEQDPDYAIGLESDDDRMTILRCSASYMTAFLAREMLRAMNTLEDKA